MNKNQKINKSNEENFEDGINEFSTIVNTASKKSANGFADEDTVDIMSTIDEFQRSKCDRHKQIPRVNHYSLLNKYQQKQKQKYNKINLPIFQVAKTPQIRYSCNNPLQMDNNDEANESNESNASCEKVVLIDVINQIQNQIDTEVVENVIPPAMRQQLCLKRNSNSHFHQQLTNPSQIQMDNSDMNLISNVINGANTGLIADFNAEDRKEENGESPNHAKYGNGESNGININNSHSNLLKQASALKKFSSQNEFDFMANNSCSLQLMEKHEEYLNNLPEIAEQEEDCMYVHQDEVQYNELNEKEIVQYYTNFSYLPNVKDEVRAECANKSGGKECTNKKMIKCLRNIGKKVITEIGRKILSGEFNLTTISFPIKAMIPKSALEKALNSTCLFPLYMNRAAQTTDLIERFKLVICATIGNFWINCTFLKPLNPIIGETCQGTYPDGTKLYAEQIQHHPPVSYFLIQGPKKSYIYYGNYHYESHAGLNSLSLENKGKRHIKFADGQLIEYNFAQEVYSGSFFGTMKLECLGKLIFEDKKNNITCIIRIGKVKSKASDYLSGQIKQGEVVKSEIYGTYMGFIDFDGVRYWDFRYVKPFQPMIVQSPLPSDQFYRKDKNLLMRGHVKLAQQAKEELEAIQRNDQNLRKKYAKQLKKQQQEEMEEEEKEK